VYTIVQIGSTQFKVSEGDMIDTDRLKQEPGQTITLDKVLLFANGTDVRIGQPYLKDVTVSATVVNHDLGRKVIAFKYRRRKNSASKIGHRQKQTVLNITRITA